MRILVFSDCHGRVSRAQTAIEAQPEAKDIFYLGDGAKQVAGLIEIYPDRRFHIVSGNCDFGANFPESGIKTVNGARIFYTHGHNFGVKYGTERLLETAGSAGADIVLYGHTHVADTRFTDGIHLVNPGALSGGRCGYDSYAVIDILPSGIMPIIIKL